MNQNTIKNIAYIIFSLVIAYIALRFIIWLLPIVVIAIIAYYLYRKFSGKGKDKIKRINIKIK